MSAVTSGLQGACVLRCHAHLPLSTNGAFLGRLKRQRHRQRVVPPKRIFAWITNIQYQFEFPPNWKICQRFVRSGILLLLEQYGVVSDIDNLIDFPIHGFFFRHWWSSLWMDNDDCLWKIVERIFPYAAHSLSSYSLLLCRLLPSHSPVFHTSSSHRF